MREIKFRVWDKELEETLTQEEGSFQYRDREDYWMTDLEDAMGNPERFTIMQYTGLKDSDEKEIYEGDILSFTTEIYYDGVYLEKYHIEKVEFDEGSYWAHGHWLTEIIANDYGVKVIGNIYENPELLEREAE